VRAAAAKAESLRPLLGRDSNRLVASVWLHDLGYAPSIRHTGFHPLDGAEHLRRLRLDDRLCCLVANHSGAKYEAVLRGLGGRLATFPDERSFVREALWYCDMTTSPSGQPVSFDDRLAEIRQRYGEDHTVPRGVTAAADEIRAAIATVVAAARAHGLLLVS